MNHRSVRNTVGVAVGLLLMVAWAYLLQFLWLIGDKGQSPMGLAFETIGHHAMRKQYTGMPQMRVVRAFAEPNQCSFWTFEATWGRCVGVGLDVRDYQLEHQPIVDAQVRLLAKQMRKPCVLVRELGLPNEQELVRDLGCGTNTGTFKLKILVTSVTVLSDQSDPANPHMWWATNHKKLYSYHFEGKF